MWVVTNSRVDLYMYSNVVQYIDYINFILKD